MTAPVSAKDSTAQPTTVEWRQAPMDSAVLQRLLRLLFGPEDDHGEDGDGDAP
jgi:hypothetical protein